MATKAKKKVIYFMSLMAFLSTIFFPTRTMFGQGEKSAASTKKRDPFVALVNSQGKIKAKEELFPSIAPKSLSMNIVLKAIIWDEARPLAMINNKVYGQGSEITKGLIVEKINPNDVVLNDNGNPVVIQLRKAVKND
ncbi:MAG: general secretion pathway protein GspB [Candidatus Omnitrophota bacterium]